MGEPGLAVARTLGLHGRVTAAVVDTAWLETVKHDAALAMDPPHWALRQQAGGGNVLCTGGLTALAAALVWAGVQDQAGYLGITSPTYLTPFFGAVGDGTDVTPAASDTALVAELSRTTVGAAAPAPATPTIDAQATWLFYYAPPAVAWNISEFGAFANASSTSGSGTMIDHYAFTENVTVSSPDSLIVQFALSVSDAGA